MEMFRWTVWKSVFDDAVCFSASLSLLSRRFTGIFYSCPKWGPICAGLSQLPYHNVQWKGQGGFKSRVSVPNERVCLRGREAARGKCPSQRVYDLIKSIHHIWIIKQRHDHCLACTPPPLRSYLQEHARVWKTDDPLTEHLGLSQQKTLAQNGSIISQWLILKQF